MGMILDITTAPALVVAVFVDRTAIAHPLAADQIRTLNLTVPSMPAAVELFASGLNETYPDARRIQVRVDYQVEPIGTVRCTTTTNPATGAVVSQLAVA
jgi:hypothetical protein